MIAGAVSAALQELLDAAADDRRVAGVILHGSRSIEGMARPDSDHDLFVIDETGPARRWATAELDVVTIPLSAWPRYAMPGEPEAWNRPALVHARLLYERPGSDVGRDLDRKRRLTADESAELARAALDEYVNDCYRSLNNHGGGRAMAAALDAAESASPLLTMLFALHGRVRPYNRHLMWELARDPLPDPALAAERLTEHLRVLTSGGDPAGQRELFTQVERIARERGCGDVIDEWAEKLVTLRPSRSG